MRPDASDVDAVATPQKADSASPDQLACEVPGELISYAVKEGDVLTEGEPLCTLESMKMEMIVSVPEQLAGRVVKALPIRVRTKAAQGGKVTPGDLILELQPIR